MILQPAASPTYIRNLESNARIKVNEGGSRSGKTYSILSLIIFKHCFEKTGQIITIARSQLAEAKGTVYRDFIDILEFYGLYNRKAHNKGDYTYRLNGNLIEFIGMDKAQKKRGSKRDILYMNEANGFKFEDWFQLAMRTTGQIYLDYNPSEVDHWIYDRVIPRADAELITSTYLDNMAFLPQTIIDWIEGLDDVDPTYAAIYKYGVRAALKGKIFTNYVLREPGTFPNEAKLIGYGLDFGYTNHPSALVKVGLYQGELWAEEKLYAFGQRNSDISREMKAVGVRGFSAATADDIIADNAEPKSIDEIYDMGWNIYGCTKGKDSVNFGIDVLKRYKINVIGDNLHKEFKNYKWKQDKNENILNTPVDEFNHGIDALRYVAVEKLGHKEDFNMVTLSA